jgi:hypothetical protein
VRVRWLTFQMTLSIRRGDEGSDRLLRVRRSLIRGSSPSDRVSASSPWIAFGRTATVVKLHDLLFSVQTHQVLLFEQD